ncbi:glucosamine-6-phosphate deaminase [Zooshikella harenae]|uniref:Glucosamine-6-phosphate deaminase n=1 Tax=Zooshikella harenae TaxID=2827238 RepID=A0ABS5ZGD4_9GAMM|nr:glucosamine-6-phosphate deaminase [Zooshikella harenae]MBU2713111.1 glucosamine-6-phosphate deaminase [Zooshikella harenae]
MRLIPLPKAANVSHWVAYYIIEQINQFKPTKQHPFILGLPTGGTPLGVYQTLIEAYKQQKISFKHVITFNMDEYVGLAWDHPQSYHFYMQQNFFQHIDIPEENTHIPNGNTSDLEAECKRYEQTISKYGGVHLFLGGVGSDGHIAFNEPGSSLVSKTRIKTLTDETRHANARFFNDDLTAVPKLALTVGIGSLLDAKELLIMATGTNKADAVQHAVEGSVSHQWPVTAIQLHPKAIITCDHDAAQELKVKTLKYYQKLEAEIISQY